MKSISKTLLIVASVIVLSMCKSKQSVIPTYNYEVQCLGTGKQGTQLIKIWAYGKTASDAIEQAKMNAVHAVIFKGIQTGQLGCMKSPLVSDTQAEQKYKEYFETFFSTNGKYLKYVSLSTDGSINPEDRLKVGKQYKIGVAVVVNSDALRKELEAADIIKKLGSGF